LKTEIRDRHGKNR